MAWRCKRIKIMYYIFDYILSRTDAFDHFLGMNQYARKLFIKKNYKFIGRRECVRIWKSLR